MTGASSGIGRAIEKRLRAEGWEVIGLTRSEMDLANLEQVAAGAAKLSKELMQIDAFIYVAGMWHDDEKPLANLDLEDFSPEQIADTMNVGVTSFMILAASLMPKLTKHGMVVGISGTFEDDGASGWLPYYTSKHALEDFLVGLAQDYPNGPYVFGISPSDTATLMYRKFYPQYAATGQPPEVIAELVAQLAGKALPYKTGDIVEIRGGKHRVGYHK